MSNQYISVQHISKPFLDKYQKTSKTIGVLDIDRIVMQHNDLCQKISDIGANISIIPCPKTSITSLAVIAGRIAVIGKNSQDNNAHSTIASVLAGSRILKFIEGDGILDGRDIVRIGDKFIIAITGKTNHEGALQLAMHLKDAGYEVEIIESFFNEHATLHEHTVFIDNNTVIVSEDFEKHYAILTHNKIVIDRATKIIPNSLWINNALLMPKGFSDIEEKLRNNGINIHSLNLSEFEKIGLNIKDICMITTEAQASENIDISNYVNDRAKASHVGQ